MAAWWKSFKGRLSVYLVPVCTLGVLEFLIRYVGSSNNVSSNDTLTFIGPTLAAIGISFALPITTKRLRTNEQDIESLRKRQGKIPPDTMTKLEDIVNARDELRKVGVSIQFDEAKNLIYFGWLLIAIIFIDAMPIVV